jgi:surface protein
MFYYCTSLTSVPLFDTSNVTKMYQMFENCNKLTTIPLFDTSNVTDMDWMFVNCVNVQSGALALYQQASTQTNPPANHTLTFSNCGRDTQTGSAELAQIPQDWGGTKP